jgi:hypothetical protein
MNPPHGQCNLFYGAPRLFMDRRNTGSVAYEKHCPKNPVIIKYFSVDGHSEYSERDHMMSSVL